MNAPYKTRRPGSLKDAFATLVALCGGQKCAARLTRVGKSQIHRYTDESDDHEFCHAPADIVAVLEKHCGDPVVTRFLAAMAGYALVAVQRSGESETLAAAVARIAEEASRLFGDAAKHLARGRSGRADELRRDAMLLMRQVSVLLTDLDAGPP